MGRSMNKRSRTKTNVIIIIFPLLLSAIALAVVVNHPSQQSVFHGSQDYFISTSNFDPKKVVVYSPFNLDYNFHTYTFKVDDEGNAVWERDGIQQASYEGFFIKNPMIISLGGGQSQVPSKELTNVYFDNVVVKTP